ncbi:MAG: hypothetical protein PWP31_272 [Clostridia bacterium]|nr:hypothetical protein [Clostridia bacterium]
MRDAINRREVEYVDLHMGQVAQQARVVPLETLTILLTRVDEKN